jgi:carboxypeptidase T
MPRYRVTIFGRDYDAMADLVREYKVDVLRQTVRELDEGGYSVDAIVDDTKIRTLETREYAVERHEDVDEVGRARQEEVSRGNDYEQPTPD